MVKGSTGWNYKIEGVILSVSKNFNMLIAIKTGKEIRHFDCLSIAEVVNIDIEVVTNDEFMRVVAAWERNDENRLRKVEKG